MPTAVIVFVSLCGLLVVGKTVRLRVPVLQRLYLPSSVIGGLIGLAVLSVAGDKVPRMERISGASLDFLVVSAVATISVKVVADNWVALAALVVAGTIWSVFAVLWFGPRCFKEAWFERSIADFGQATGVTATGLMLLRTVDPDSRTCAAASFGYKQLLHEPIMGGGVCTALAFTLVVDIGWFKVFAFSVVMLAIWIFCAWRLSRSTAAPGTVP